MLTGRSVKVDLVAPAVVNRQVVYEADVPPFPNKISEERMANQRTLKYLYLLTIYYHSFCSTSISVKVSMISPTWMSLKLTSEIPHSKPVATSLASSL